MHLLVGKSLPNGGFVRLQGENSIYVVDRDLRREIGLLTHDPSKGPDQSKWVNKTIMELEKEDIDRLSIIWPDRKAVFAKRIKTDSAPDEKTETIGPQKETPPLKGSQWIAIDAAGPFPVKEKAVDGIIDALARLTAEDIVDPNEKKARGLDAAPFQCTVALKQGGKRVLIASHPNLLQDGYMMVEGGDGTLFRVSRYTFQRVFKKGTDLFDLPPFSVDKTAIREVSLRWPQRTLLIRKTASGEFKALSGNSEGKKLDQNELKMIWDSLSRISPTDFVHLHPEIERGLGEPPYLVTITLTNGNHHVIALGDEARGVAGRYMKIDDGPQIFVMAKTDFDRIFHPMDQLFENRTPDKGK